MAKNLNMFTQAMGISYLRGSDLLEQYDELPANSEPVDGEYYTPASPPPLIKRDGGKQRLAPRIAAILAPAISTASTYYEPFVGAGGVLLRLISAGALEGKRVVASDVNRRLIDFHKTVQETPEELIAELRKFKYLGGVDAYNELLYDYNTTDDEFTHVEHSRAYRAAEFYVLMQKSFNGACRANLMGEFNAPIGLPCGKLAFKLTDETAASIMAVSRATAGVTFVAQDYAEAVKTAAGAPAQSFIYADPPYEGSLSDCPSASYSAAALFDAIAQSGAAAAISNSQAARALACEKLPACEIADLADLDIKYSVGASGGPRGRKVELLIRVAPGHQPSPDEDVATLMSGLSL